MMILLHFSPRLDIFSCRHAPHWCRSRFLDSNWKLTFLRFEKRYWPRTKTPNHTQGLARMSVCCYKSVVQHACATSIPFATDAGRAPRPLHIPSLIWFRREETRTKPSLQDVPPNSFTSHKRFHHLLQFLIFFWFDTKHNTPKKQQ